MTQNKVQAVALALQNEFAGGTPPALSHCQALDVAARLLGAGAHWREAGASARKARSNDSPDRPKHFVWIKEVDSGAVYRYDPWACAEGPWEALDALALALPCPKDWTASSWGRRAREIWAALRPALEEQAMRDGRAVTADDCLRAATWEGIGALRLDDRLTQSARSALGAWARPWHSAFNPEIKEFAAVRDSWAGALIWLKGLASAGKGSDPDWPSALAQGLARIEKGNPFSAALCLHLCRKSGAEPRCEKTASICARSWFKTADRACRR